MIEILQSGLYTSIQDLGRVQYRNFGVPVSGVMDPYHAILANQLLGNDENDAVLEMTLQGPRMRFHEATQIVICGANLSPTLNNQPIRLNLPMNVSKGDQLDFGKRQYGVRAYLAVKNGFQTEKILQSRSSYEGITPKSRVATGDFIPYQTDTTQIQTKANIAIQHEIFTNSVLQVYEGPEFEFLSTKQQEILFNQRFSVGLNNRMAYQSEEIVANDCPSIITSAVLPGTVQLTPSGKLIILMKDCQTTGGYPRILQLDAQSMIALAQKHTKDRIYFKKLLVL
ncbi:MAG: biotin-dependent carboxyltransferase family protein [Bacteroidota bacterium]